MAVHDPVFGAGHVDTDCRGFRKIKNNETKKKRNCGYLRLIPFDLNFFSGQQQWAHCGPCDSA